MHHNTFCFVILSVSLVKKNEWICFNLACLTATHKSQREIFLDKSIKTIRNITNTTDLTHKQHNRTQAMDTMLTGSLNNSVKTGMVHNNKYLYKSNDYIKNNLPSNSLKSMNTHNRQHKFDEHVLAAVLLSATQWPTCVHVHMAVGCECISCYY